MTFNMNMAVPYMTYQMTPMMVGGTGMMVGGTGFAGAGMLGGSFGMPMAGSLPIMPMTGLNMGLGGGLQMSLGANALAALGLAAPAGVQTSGTSAMEMLLLRALLGRTEGNGTAATSPAAPTAPGAAEIQAQMKALSTEIGRVMTAINKGVDDAQTMKKNIDDNSMGILMLNQRIDDLQKEIKKNRPE